MSNAQDMPLASRIYHGTVVHRRHRPVAHGFDYRIVQPYLDLDEIGAVLAMNRWWTRDRRGIAELRRSDFHRPGIADLAAAVRTSVAERRGHAPRGPIRLLAHARHFGYSFNPVSFYYCFEADGRTLDCILAEITNTPWKERHAYLLDAALAERDGDWLEWSFDKCFHVSPFIAMQRRYAWRLRVPGERLGVHMKVIEDETREFDATLALQQAPMTAGALDRLAWRHPAMTMKVIAAIYWQALRLKVKGVPAHDHPNATTAKEITDAP